MLNSLLNGFEPITLGEMDGVKLMNRVDTKYVTSVSALEDFLAAAKGGYRCLLTGDGDRICPYSTLYYDTEDLEMYRIHHSGKRPRYKVRVRTYVNSGETFLEIKHKNNKGRTKKKRVRCVPEDVFNQDRTAFLKDNSPYCPEDLAPRLETSFDRITLTDNALSERITIDFNLTFTNVYGSGTSDFGDGVIIELKQSGNGASETKRILRDCGIKPLRLSKYCVGTVLTNPHIKCGNFKTKLITAGKTINKKLI